MAVDIIGIINNALSQRIDQTVTTVAVTLLLFFYGGRIIKWAVRRTKGAKAKRFVVFAVLALFGTSILMVILTNIILSVANPWLRWGIIALLIIWSFFKFDQEVLRKD